jgi:uncharacterized protein
MISPLDGLNRPALHVRRILPATNLKPACRIVLVHASTLVNGGDTSSNVRRPVKSLRRAVRAPRLASSAESRYIVGMAKSAMKKAKKTRNGAGTAGEVKEPSRKKTAKAGSKRKARTEPNQSKKPKRSGRLTTAAALFAAIESRNPEAVAALYADDVQVWHNFSDACQDKPTNLAVLTGLCQSVPEIHYDVIERLLLDDGRVMQRHVLRAKVESGDEILIPACMFIAVRRGKITRIDEYLDTAQANRLRQASGRPPVAVPGEPSASA